MNKAYSLICTLIFLLTLNSCKSQETKSNEAESPEPPQVSELNNELFFTVKTPEEAPISEYIRNSFQDKNGGLWFGTNGDGIAHFDGTKLSYYLKGLQITGITADLEGNIWFASDRGIIQYDWSSKANGEKAFLDYPGSEFADGRRFWSIFADSKGTIWAGSQNGIFCFKGSKWESFDLPFATKEESGSFITNRTIWSISEDKKGNIWFGTNGSGAFKFDGENTSQFTTKDGLTDNAVDNILEDRNGNIWFGTRYGGLSRYDGSSFTNFSTENSIGDDEVCVIFEDKEGNIWCSSEGYGVYRFDGEKFTNFAASQGLGVKAVQTIFEDNEGRFWVGGGGGLYRFNGESFYHVSQAGPWE